MVRRARFVLAALAMVAGAACTVKDTEPPPLTGPSNVTANPLTPTAVFVFSPAAPVTNRDVQFDASPSCPVAGCATASGHTITEYTWNFGDGTLTSGRFASHKFANAGNFTVALTVTNDVGLASLTSGVVQVSTAAAPTASFTVSPASPQVGQSAGFNGNASAAAQGRTLVSYEWNFGDGATASGPTATHAFSAPGTYNVGLVVVDDVGQRATATNSVTVVPVTPVPPTARPSAAFVFSPTAPQTGQAVSFNGTQSTAASGHTIVSYDWNFGDGSTGTGVVSTHSFGSAGTYNVTLLVTDDLGQTGTASNSVTVNSTSATPPPTAVFVFSPSAPGTGQSVLFNGSQSSAAAGRTIVSYSWNFGDGATASGVTAPHTFATAGTFNVVLVVTDDLGQRGTTTQGVTVTTSGDAGPPTAVFNFSPSAPGVGESVFFNATQSTAAAGHSITSYAWNFGDGFTGSGVTTSHSFSTAGTYSVTLKVTDDTGKSTTSSPQTITVGNPPAPTAKFTFSPSNPVVGQPVVFDTAGTTTAQGQSIAKFDWNFGDGTGIVTCHVPAQGGDAFACTGGTNRTISHTYSTSGTYTVNLVVTDTAGRTGSANATLSVGSAFPVASFTCTVSNAGTHTMSCNGGASTAPAGSTITSYAWTFGDGGTGTGVTAPHTYPAAGNYSVQLTVTDSQSRTGTATQVINVP